MKYIQKFNESDYSHLRHLLDDFTDDYFQVRDIRHWKHNTSSDPFGRIKGWIDGKFNFVSNLEKLFEFKELDDYTEDLIDNLDALYSRLKEVGDYLTIKVTFRCQEHERVGDRVEDGDLWFPKFYDAIEVRFHKENCGNSNIHHMERKIKESIQQLKLYGAIGRKNTNLQILVIINVSFQTKEESVFEDKILKRHLYYIDSINESIISDAGSYLHKVFDRISKASQNHKKKILVYALSGLIFTSGFATILNTIKTDPIIKKELNDKELRKIMHEKLKKELFKDPSKMKVSKKGWNNLKYEEGSPKQHGEPILKVYKIGDGAVTVGWGHAEKIGKSKFVVGQTITREEAQKLLEKDATLAANGVRKLFSDWQAQGIDRHITQDMFDAMVSMAFNMGIGGLRGSQLVQELKAGNYKKAGELIKKTKVNKKFAGLTSRRERESDLFLSFVDKLKEIEEV